MLSQKAEKKVAEKVPRGSPKFRKKTKKLRKSKIVRSKTYIGVTPQQAVTRGTDGTPLGHSMVKMDRTEENLKRPKTCGQGTSSSRHLKTKTGHYSQQKAFVETSEKLSVFDNSKKSPDVNNLPKLNSIFKRRLVNLLAKGSTEPSEPTAVPYERKLGRNQPESNGDSGKYSQKPPDAEKDRVILKKSLGHFLSSKNSMQSLDGATPIPSACSRRPPTDALIPMSSETMEIMNKRFAGRSSFFGVLQLLRNQQKRSEVVNGIKGVEKNISRRLSCISPICEDDGSLATRIPESPRFCATLSPEAQFAFMKGYEDRLVKSLEDLNYQQRIKLHRVSTPPQNTRLQKVLPSKNYQETSVTDLDLDEKKAEVHHELPVQPAMKVDAHPIQPAMSPKSSFPAIKMSSSQDFAKTEPKVAIGPSVSAQTKSEQFRNQLMMSCRFQNAMDILDSMHESQGRVVTSYHHKSWSINPVKHYNMWVGTYGKEFSFDKNV